MSESPATENLNDYLTNCISEFLATMETPQMMTGFVAAIETIDAAGDQNVFMAYPVSQPPHRGVGLTTFAAEWFRDDIQASFYPCPHGEGDE